MRSRISVGPACRAGLRGHAATSDQSRSEGRRCGDVERMCDPWRFALRRKSFPAERTYQTQSFPAERTYQTQSFPAERTYFQNHPRLHPTMSLGRFLVTWLPIPIVVSRQIHHLARERGWIQSAASNSGDLELSPAVKSLNLKDRRWKPELSACRMSARARCLTP